MQLRHTIYETKKRGRTEILYIVLGRGRTEIPYIVLGRGRTDMMISHKCIGQGAQFLSLFRSKTRNDPLIHLRGGYTMDVLDKVLGETREEVRT